MLERARGPRAAIVDYSMGNLYSVQSACDQVDLSAVVTSSPEDVRAADGVILPGVGGMPDAMRVLQESGLADALRDAVAAEKPVLGICLGLQLLMTKGTEFESHDGLGIIPGTVVRLRNPMVDERRLKVPHVGWNRVWRETSSGGQLPVEDRWGRTPLAGLADGAFMYFVHSFCVEPTDPSVRVARTRYGETDFCSALGYRNVFGCQFHPERSGSAGLCIYRQFATLLRSDEASGEEESNP